MNNSSPYNIAPLRVIRVVGEMTAKEMAGYFECTPAYINAVENGDRVMRKQTLKYGLDKLNITMQQYETLSKFSDSLLNREYPDKTKLKLMILETYAVIDSTPEEQEQIEALIETIMKNFENKVK